MIAGHKSPVDSLGGSSTAAGPSQLFLPLSADLLPVDSRPPSSLLDAATPKHVSFEETSSSDGSEDDFDPKASGSDNRPAMVRGVKAGVEKPSAANVGLAREGEMKVLKSPPPAPRQSVVSDAAATGVAASLANPPLSGFYEPVSSASSVISPTPQPATTGPPIREGQGFPAAVEQREVASPDAAPQTGEAPPTRPRVGAQGRPSAARVTLDVGTIMGVLRELPNLSLSHLARFLANDRRLTNDEADDVYRDLQLAQGGQRTLASRLQLVLSAMPFSDGASEADVLQEVQTIIEEVLGRPE